MQGVLASARKSSVMHGPLRAAPRLLKLWPTITGPDGGPLAWNGIRRARIIVRDGLEGLQARLRAGARRETDGSSLFRLTLCGGLQLVGTARRTASLQQLQVIHSRIQILGEPAFKTAPPVVASARSHQSV